MKDLSIEEKAKRYDEAIEQLKKMMPNWKNLSYNGKTFLQDLVHIIPELKESEDERIRLEIVSCVQNYGPRTANPGLYIRMIDWLENQGEKQKEYDVCDSCDQQGTCVDPCPVKLVEKQGEQKPADKDEPKFHVGDWLVENVPNNYARFIQILEIVNVQGKDRYRISRDIHKDEDVVEIGFVEKYYHNFNIQDAKDGDVLADENSIVIFRKIGNERWSDMIDYYAVLYKTNDFLIQRGIDYWGTTEETDLRPATKEQRACLLQKMHEAGYEWDAEYLELRKLGLRTVDLGKVEQKPAEWSEEDDNTLLDTINILRSCGRCSTDRKLWLLSLKDRVIPQSHWKPSDEQMKALRKASKNEYLTAEQYDILVSLYDDIKKLGEE